MKNKFFLASLALFSIFVSVPIQALASVEPTDEIVSATPTKALSFNGWEELSNDEGILVHRKDVEGNDVVAFRGEAVFDASIAKVANVLLDTSRKKEWVDRLAEAENIREIGPYERIEYNHTATPIIIKDRDFVFHAKAEMSKKTRSLVFNLKSVEDPLKPEVDPVRANLIKGQYTLTPEGDGSKTRCVVEIHADPRGSVPKWIVNLFQKSWPRRTLDGIRNQVAKPDVTEHPGVKAFFDGLTKNSRNKS